MKHGLGSISVKISMDNKQCYSFSRVDYITPWTAFHKSPPFMVFLRQEYWSGLPFPSPGNLSNPGIKLESTHTLLEKQTNKKTVNGYIKSKQ